MKIMQTGAVAIGIISTGLVSTYCNRAKSGSDVSAASSSAFIERLTSDGVWKQVVSDPYKILPKNEVSLWKFSSTSILGVPNPSPDVLTTRAVSTVMDSQNIVQRFDKLVHPNGICLTGRWVITEDSPFTGYFKKGTDAPFIGRASSAFSGTTRGEYRAFGLAGKIFMEKAGSTRPQDFQVANFFTIDDLAGTMTASFGDLPLSNEPPFTKSAVLAQGPTVGLIGAATIAAFTLADSNPGIRQLYQIAELGMENPAKAITPKWMHLSRISKLKHERPDFRWDLRVSPDKELSNFDGKLEFQITVSSDSQVAMKPIGKIILDRSVVSDTCDHRLHFNHPKFREDLNYR